MIFLTKQNEKLFFYLLLCIATIGCQEDIDDIDLDEKLAQELPYSSRTISEEDYIKNERLTSKLKTVLSNIDKSSNRSIYNEEYDFYIQTHNVRYIESTLSDYHSYTFAIEDAHKNIVFSYNTNSQDYDSYLFEYLYTPDQIEEFENTGHVSTYVDLKVLPFEGNIDELLSRIVDCSVSVITYHTTPDTCETFVYGEGDECQHMVDGVTQCYVHYETVVNYCTEEDNSGTPPDGGSGGSGGTNDPPADDPVVTQPTEPDYVTPILTCLNGTSLQGDPYTSTITEADLNLLDTETQLAIKRYLIRDNSCSPEAQDFAEAAIMAFLNGGDVDFEELYIEVDTPDDDYVFIGQKQRIPNPLILDSGSEIEVTFITYTNDDLSSDQEVAELLIDGLKFALEDANTHLSDSEKISSINIYATTNGNHTGPNHYNGTAIDINRINGVRMAQSGVTNQIIELQKAFDNFQYIRENFGPHFNHKYYISSNTWNYNYPVGGHNDHIHISVRN